MYVTATASSPPPGAAEATVFQWLRLPATRPASPRVWVWLAVLVLAAWLGSTAFVGAYRPTQVTRLLEALVPGRTMYGLACLLAVVIALGAARAARHELVGAAAIVAAFLAGHLVYAAIYPFLPGRVRVPFDVPADWAGFAAFRLGYAASILAVCLPVWWLVVARRHAARATLRFGWGDWSVRGRDLSARSRSESWARRIVTGYLGFTVVIFFVMQANVGFAPLRSPATPGFLPAVVAAALANAVAEELVFRGVLQPAFVRFGGLAAGIWMQGLLFGLVHWGNSVGVLAALPVSLMIGLGSVVWGKAAVETAGLGWVIIAHAMLDVGVMTAFFVPA